VELTYIVFVGMSFIACLVSAVFGFGTALIVIAVGSHILPIKEVIALATVLFIASTLTKSIIYGKHIDWKLTSIMSLVSLPFAYLGASYLNEVPAELLKRLIGIMVLSYLLLTTFNWMPKFKIGLPGIVLGSASYGFISGLLGSGNIIKAILFREMNISKQAFVGAMAATSVLANVVKLSAYEQANLINIALLWPMVSLAIVAVIAVLVGRYFLHKVSTEGFAVGIQVVLAVSAIGLLR
jgi:uncharacterized membrane protein YfcA